MRLGFVLVLGFGLVLASLAPASSRPPEPVHANPEGRRAFADLGAFYADPQKEPPYREALAGLADPDKAVRSRAAQYFFALFAQALVDESTGRASVTQTPFWGTPAISDSRELRARMADAFGEATAGEEAEPVVRWLLMEEKDTKIQNAGLKAAGKNAALRTPGLIEDLLVPPHPNPTVLVAAIGEAGRQRLKSSAPSIERLTRHHRAKVRDAARMTAPVFGTAVPKSPVPEGDLLLGLDAEIRKIGGRVMTPIPRGARWARVKYEVAPFHGRGEPEEREASAWIIAETDSTLRILDEFGRDVTIDRGTSTLTPETLQDEGARLISVREGGDRSATESLSREGGLTGQFETSVLSLPEALVATWAYLAGDRETAASILIPRVEAMDSDLWLGMITSDLIGNIYHLEMLEAFSFDRDYARTIAIARHLSRPEFDGYHYQRRAVELARQLARRGEDFKTFRLPTPAEWEALKGRLPREKQIAYLAERLRLLNCIQQMQPGGPFFGDTQYAEPFHIKDQWQDLANSSDEVINPLTALGGMDLGLSDIPALVPFLADHNFMPTYSFWRDFHPDRDLHRVGEMAEGLINQIAKQPLASEMRAFELEGRERDAYFDSLVTWSRAHGAHSEEDLTIELLETTSDGHQFMMAAERAVKFPRALSIILRRMEEFPRQRMWLIATCLRFDSPDAVPKAREWVKEDLFIYRGMGAQLGLDSHESKSIRFYSAMILLRHGDRSRNEGYPELKALLVEDDEGYWTRQCYTDLLALGDPDAFRLVCSVVKRSRFGLPTYDNDALLLSLFHMGCEDCFDYLLETLASEKSAGTAYETVDGKQVVTEIFEGDKVAALLAGWRTDGFPYNERWPKDARASARQELRGWLLDQIARVRACEKPDIKEPRN